MIILVVAFIGFTKRISISTLLRLILISSKFRRIVGMMADPPIDLKTFHCRIINDTQKLQAEEAAYVIISDVRKVTPELIQHNYD